MQELKCNICGAQIGGVNHRLRSDNVFAKRYGPIKYHFKEDTF